MEDALGLVERFVGDWSARGVKVVIELLEVDERDL